jgi:hypothetical protein
MAVDWVAAVAASIAALASVAVFLRQHSYVAWEIRERTSDATRPQLVNMGNGTAYRVQMRIGSASDPSDGGQVERRRQVRPGEAMSFSNWASYGGPDDYAVNVSWRGLLRRRSWSRPLI